MTMTTPAGCLEQCRIMMLKLIICLFRKIMLEMAVEMKDKSVYQSFPFAWSTTFLPAQYLCKLLYYSILAKWERKRSYKGIFCLRTVRDRVMFGHRQGGVKLDSSLRQIQFTKICFEMVFQKQSFLWFDVFSSTATTLYFFFLNYITWCIEVYF